jgi:D-alanyl-D-alanine carboxypeptidase
MYKVREYRHNNITQYNRNRLLGRDPYVDGMKTGYTENAGYCMVATALRRDRRLIAVVINAGSENARAVDAQKLLNYGFEPTIPSSSMPPVSRFTFCRSGRAVATSCTRDCPAITS